MKNVLSFLLICQCIACSTNDRLPIKNATTTFTKVSFYKYPYSLTDTPFKYKLEYYFEDGTPHRWIALNASGTVTSQYIYNYDKNGKHIGAEHKEEDELDHRIARVRYENDSVNNQNEWIIRKKIKNDTIQEIQIKQVYTDNQFTNADGTFYESIVSTKRWSENTFSFTNDEQILFLTRTSDWQNQFGVQHKKQDGLFTSSERIAVLDSIYNGAISPSGTKIIYCGTKANDGQIYLLEKEGDQWQNPINLTKSSGIKGGYFYWLTDTDLFSRTLHRRRHGLGRRRRTRRRPVRARPPHPL
ncbi:MAG: hypothetical protein AAF617_10490, partial [Bacteroidota bacterium]